MEEKPTGQVKENKTTPLSFLAQGLDPPLSKNYRFSE